MEEDKLNNLSKKLFENIELEKLPQDFTDKLMLKLEQVKTATIVKPTTFYKNKFLLLFILTFSIITLMAFLVPGSKDASNAPGIAEKIGLNQIDLSFLNKYFDISINFGLIAKLVIGSIIILIVIDLLSGSLIDRIIDSKTKKENQT
jgi:hypothetical protein